MITVLTGENSFLLQAELNQLIADFVTNHTDMGLERIDGEEVSYSRMREALESLPFLTSRKLIVLTKPSSNKEFLDKASDLFAAVPETNDVLVVEPKPDKRTSYYKLFKKIATLKDFPEMDEHSLSNWLTTRAKEQGGSLSLVDARILINRIGANQRMLHNELAKLLNYNPDITSDSIELLTESAPQSTIFELLDAALAGKFKRTLELYEEQRALKVEPQQIIAMLAWQLHVLAIVKTAISGKDAASIAKDAKINPFVIRKTQNLARQMSLEHIKRLIRRTLELDIRLKSQSIDADEALQNLLINVSQI